MLASGDDVLTRLRLALTGAADTPLVLIGNFDVEDCWAVGEQGLPSVAFGGSRAIVNRMDAFALFLGSSTDHVVLKDGPEPDYLDYLARLGLDLPRVLTVRDGDPKRIVTEDALDDPDLLAELAGLGARGAWLWPHGVSEYEQRLARLTGLPLAGATAAVCKAVNSKIYSRLLADSAGVRQAEGMVIRDLDEFAAARDLARAWLTAGRTVVFKDAYGVSGKGLLVIRAQERLDRLANMIIRRADRKGDRRLALLLEEWLPNRTDVNYQFTVGQDGGIHFDVVKEAITAAGVHQGHRMPARLNGNQMAEIRDTAMLAGARLAADGYAGVVGVDALVTTDDRLYPMVEINARNNMSTYQERLRQPFFDRGQSVLARQYPVRLDRPLPFAELRTLVADLLLRPGTATGIVLNNVATVNAAAPTDGSGTSFDGRLYAIVIAASAHRAEELDRELAARLATLSPASNASHASAPDNTAGDPE